MLGCACRERVGIPGLVCRQGKSWSCLVLVNWCGEEEGCVGWFRGRVGCAVGARGVVLRGNEDVM
jgi:hypothetical protein